MKTKVGKVKKTEAGYDSMSDFKFLNDYRNETLLQSSLLPNIRVCFNMTILDLRN